VVDACHACHSLQVLTTSTTTTTVTKEVLPTSPSSGSVSTVSSPTLLAVNQCDMGFPSEPIDSSGTPDVAEIIAEIEEVAAAEALVKRHLEWT